MDDNSKLVYSTEKGSVCPLCGRAKKQCICNKTSDKTVISKNSAININPAQGGQVLRNQLKKKILLKRKTESCLHQEPRLGVTKEIPTLGMYFLMVLTQRVSDTVSTLLLSDLFLRKIWKKKDMANI
jgi:hypothetical protein